MLRCLALMAALPAAALAQDVVDQAGDIYSLTRQGPDLGVVEYHNSERRASPGTDVTLVHDGLSVVVVTHVNGWDDGAEVIEVIPPDGWIADPPSLDVPDGASGTVILMRWLGG